MSLYDGMGATSRWYSCMSGMQIVVDA